MLLAETQRLRLRPFTLFDAQFMLALLNDAGWLRYIGDRGVRTVEQAELYLQNGAIANYQTLGFGFYCVELRETGAPIGMCGLTQRDYLPDPDLGFAFLSDFVGQGYAKEAALAVMAYAQSELDLKHILATTRPDNFASAKVLEALGMRFRDLMMHPDGDRQLKLYEINL
ncbi:GNAT family N-acetyltransferase [Undibacterium cyanobacteriorum]|uniref:GNAT family N-acetyltransferase n=1 Tax=Undibacterium cyanobacteriorum TaxID=3073561 RepID=A0ABY9RMA6_9BURK|nr:GNAT family N-acetyltransferase [Undibacterium sp. 20NA77.5]WMW81131.1 GNAT family N-acetyltransferase [Undibacterium sp. 20NA77.5]